MTTEPIDDVREPHVKPFADWLAAQRNGQAATEWAEAMIELQQAVETHQKKGTVTFTVTLTPAGPAYAVTDEIKLTLPKAPPEPSLFFGDEDGNLVRTDPRQQSFGGLREVAVETEAGIREVDVQTGEIR